MIGRLDEVVLDGIDIERVAQFWRSLLGGELVRQSDEWIALRPPSGITVSFQRVPERKAGKNRVHLDVDVDDLDAATVAAEAIGATRIGVIVVDELGGFQVMADPEGNEFCLVHGATPITT